MSEEQISIQVELSVELHKVVMQLSKLYGRSVAQVLLEWTEDDLQQGMEYLIAAAKERGWCEFGNYSDAVAYASRLKIQTPEKAVVIEPYPRGGYFVDYLETFSMEFWPLNSTKSLVSEIPSDHAEIL